MPPSEPTTDHLWPAEVGDILLHIARAAIAAELDLSATPPTTAQWLDRVGATFVTLYAHGRLRGCIGTIIAHRPIAEDIRINACNAAFRDPRFEPVTPQEYPDLRLEVSQLSSPEPLTCTSEDELINRLRPGIDGVLLTAGEHRGTFLPQVWKQLPRKADFVTELKTKAGVADQPWDPTWQVSRYTITAWSET